MLLWLTLTVGIAVGSALFPLLSIEVFVVGLFIRQPHLPYLLFGAAAAVGQVIGKLLYFYAGRGTLHLPKFLHRHVSLDTPRPKSALQRGFWWHALTERVRLGWMWLRIRCRRHPRWMFGATVTSSVLGVPPLLATTVLAGLAGLSLRAFIIACLPGRFARFSALAAAPVIMHHWLHLAHLSGL